MMRYSLADILPSVAAALGMDVHNPLGLRPNRDVVVLLVDGLGAELLARHRDTAPTLAAHVATTVATGFPATTAVGLASLAVGAPCATHGIIGYSFAVPADAGPRLLNALRWRLDSATGPDAREQYPPEQIQPARSRVQDLAAHGVEVHYVVPGYQGGSGLTRAVFRAPGTLHPAEDLDGVRDGILFVAAGSGSGSRFAYAYYPELDANGHLYGPGSAQWLAELARIDALVADLLTELPATCTLIVTGDHGMIRAGEVVDLDARADLHREVRLIGGEARARHVYLERPGALPDVLAAWAEELAGHARVVSRDQALAEHWFGPTPPGPAIAERIGDIIAVARDRSVLVCPGREPVESTLLGHHGAWTDDEQLVPVVVGG